MSATEIAFRLIRPFEGCRLHAYACPAGVPTIGYGATGPDIHLGLVWTQAQADARLAADIARFERGVRRLVRVPCTDGQLGACTSLAFNIGLTAFGGSTLLRRLNAGDYAGASAQFSRWTRAAGRILPGLVRRRDAERACFDGG